jgi:hypothetical protein
MAKKGVRTIFRSAKTGRIVTKEYAQHHPATTEKEHRPAKNKNKTGGTGPRRK